MKLHRTQKEFKETTRKLEEKVDALQKQLEEKMDEKVCALQGKLEEKVGAVKADLTSKIDINHFVLDFRIDREIREISDKKKKSPSFIWKISEIHRLLSEATRSTNIKSDPFFTEANGYKLRVLMRPNGDLSRSGKTGYVSFYLVIMRGEYDAILPWPLNGTVTFRLIDQQGNPDYREDVVEELDLGEEDNQALHRPTKEENDGYGFPKFICHDKIRRRRYIVNDTAFLEVHVRPSSVSDQSGWCD